MCSTWFWVAKRASKVTNRLCCPPACVDANWKCHLWTLYTRCSIPGSWDTPEGKSDLFPLGEEPPGGTREQGPESAIPGFINWICINLNLFTILISTQRLYVSSAWILGSGGDLFEAAHCSFLEVSQAQFVSLYLHLHTTSQLTYRSGYHLDFNSGTQRWTSQNSLFSFLLMVLRCNTQ